jgi:glyoxylase-like metal-dependent hydrolase (beta-lactamase superfamily II)
VRRYARYLIDSEVSQMSPARADSGHARPVGALAHLVLCDNPGPMELDGTNTWVLQAQDADACVVVDPGPAGHPGHLEAVAAGRRVELVLITHGHHDHVGSVDAFRALTAAPVRAVSPEHCRGAEPLAHDEEFVAGGLAFQVLHTPGHTADSASFVVSHPLDRLLLTGDTVLGRGTTLLGDEPSALRDYLASLDLLTGLGGARLLPGHGRDHPDARPVLAQYRAHREQRIDAIRSILRTNGLTPGEADAEAIADELYFDTPAGARFAAVASVQAQLVYLAAE